MIRNIIIYALLIALLSNYAGAAPVKSILANNLGIIIQPENGTEVVSLNAYIRVGGAQEPQGLSGLSSVVAYALCDSTKYESRRKLQQTIQQIGGSVEVLWQPDYTRISITTTKDYLYSAQVFLCDVLKNSVFDKETTQAAIDQALKTRELASTSSMFRIAYTAACEKLYPAHPYAFPYGGNPEETKRIKPSDLKRFYAKNYVPENIVIVVVGRVDAKTVLEKFDVLLGGLENTGNPAEPIPPPIPKQASLTVQQPNVVSTYMLLNFAMPGAASDDYPAAVVLNALIGEGKSSRLFRRLRDTSGIGYEVGSALVPMSAGSQLVGFIQFIPKKDSATTVRDEMLKVMTGLLVEPPTDEELTRAKRFSVGTYALHHQRVKERANWLGFWEMQRKGYLEDTDFSAKLEAVTKEDLLRLAKAYLKEPVVVTVTSGDSVVSRD
jgi:zinc protease